MKPGPKKQFEEPYYKREKEKVAISRVRRRQRDPERHRKYMREYTAAHKETISAQRKVRYQKNREAIIAKQKARYATDKARETRARYILEHYAEVQDARRSWRDRNGAHLCMYSRMARALKMKRLYDMKEAVGCGDCGEKDPRCLDYHHRDGVEKIAAVSQLLGRAWEKVEAEVAKCEVVCANCHRKRHDGMRHQPAKKSRYAVEAEGGVCA